MDNKAARQFYRPMSSTNQVTTTGDAVTDASVLDIVLKKHRVRPDENTETLWDRECNG